MSEAKQTIVVGGVLIYENKALLIKRALHESDRPGFWELPQGKLEFGENTQQALKREFLEETGLSIERQNFLDEFVESYNSNNKRIYILGLFFKVILIKEADPLNLVLSNGHIDSCWADIKTIEQINPIDNTRRRIILSALKNIND